MKPPSIRFVVPGNFIPERRYTADVVFKEFLALDYELVVDASLTDSYLLQMGEKQIIFKDSFFAQKNEAAGYLHESNIPSNISRANGRFVLHDHLPVLFGSPHISVASEKINCGIDIFASIFFMISRWEEAVIKELDYLSRFPVHASLADKNDFLARPVVNEWLALLKNLMKELMPALAFQSPQPYQLVFTHDIDFMKRPVSLREYAKDIVKRKSLRSLLTRMSYHLSKENPYDLFDYFMDVSERHNTVSRFYFMTGHNLPGKDGENYNNTRAYLATLKKIKERGHVIGFHPSLLSYNNDAIFKKELRQLEKDCGGMQIREGRQHALRFEMPETWQLWNSNNMELDSTLGFSAKPGFRCGTGNTFSTFDVVRRVPMSLKEMPLIVMDTTLNVNQKLSLDKSEECIRHFIDVARKHDMPITLLFHNLINDKIGWRGWKTMYDKIFFS